MLRLLFSFGSEKILISINKTNVYFSNTAYGAQQSPIEGLSFSEKGVIKEFPDLDGDLKWKEKAIERFNTKLKKLKTERKKADYIVGDLAKFGYVLEQQQQEGFRPRRVI